MGMRHSSQSVSAQSVSAQSLSVASLLFGALLAGCASAPAETPVAEAPGIDSETRAVISRSDPLTQAAFWQEAYNANPTDEEAIESFASTLRTIGSLKEALEVLQKGLAIHENDPEMLLLAARTLVGMERFRDAELTYRRLLLIEPENADAHAGLGLVFDKTGRHPLAQAAYAKSLDIEPGRATTLSNYAMSLVLSGEPRQAEKLLRRAVDLPNASPMVRQNLALVVGLQGRFDEMREIGGADLPDELVENNVQVIQQMLAPTRDWTALEESETPES